MSAAESPKSLNRRELTERIYELSRQEDLTRRHLADLLIQKHDGEAMDVVEFYRSLFNHHTDTDPRPSGFTHYGEFEVLGEKIETHAQIGQLVLAVRDAETGQYDMGIISPHLLPPAQRIPWKQDAPYRYHLSGNPLGNEKEYQGSIQLPLQAISPDSRSGEPQLDNYSRWVHLARVTRSFSSVNTSQFVEAKNLHIGFDKVVLVAATLGESALKSLAVYHNHAADQSSAGTES